MPQEILAEVVRSGLVEGHHRGSVVGLDERGRVVLSVGEPDVPVYPRSANKPLQAAGMVRAGLALEPELLALAAASHSGEEFHLAGVRRILAGAGLDESALLTPPDWPLDDLARLAYTRQGLDPSPIAMNCSGKHAAMLATCVVNGWPTGTYPDPGHPLQRHLLATVAELAGSPVAHVGVDGCGTPLFALTLTALARGFRRMVLAAPGAPERLVVDAVQAHPEYTSGTTRDEARLLRAVAGTFGKSGAEGVHALALADGRAVALKVDDGAARARPVVLAAALRRIGVDHPVLDGLGRFPLLGGGRQVGEVHAVDW